MCCQGQRGSAPKLSLPSSDPFSRSDALTLYSSQKISFPFFSFFPSGFLCSHTPKQCCSSFSSFPSHLVVQEVQGQQHIGSEEARGGLLKRALDVQVVEQLATRHPLLGRGITKCGRKVW